VVGGDGERVKPEPIRGSGLGPQWGPGASPWSGSQGDGVPLKPNVFVKIKSKFSRFLAGFFDSSRCVHFLVTSFKVTTVTEVYNNNYSFLRSIHNVK
jgi:hypothetical protein